MDDEVMTGELTDERESNMDFQYEARELPKPKCMKHIRLNYGDTCHR